MTCVEDHVGHNSSDGLEDSVHDEAPAAKVADQTFEERLLLIELTEVQRELWHSKQDAKQAHEAGKAASAELHAQSEANQLEIDALRATVASLTDALNAERSRASEADCGVGVIQAKLPCTHDSNSFNTKLGPDSPASLAQIGNCEPTLSLRPAAEARTVQASESALWQALHAAQNDAAEATARAAEAQALSDLYQTQLKQAHEEQASLLREMASAVGTVCDDATFGNSQVSVVTRAHEIAADLDSLRKELETAQMLLHEEQLQSVQIREDLLREKRAAEAAIASVAAKQRQLDQWRLQSTVSHENNSVIQAEHAKFLSEPDPQEVAHALPDEQGTDVAEIVSKWRFMSMKQFSEANGLADQLAVERKALQSMRAQALMLERQVETAEDQLDSERSSAAARESSMRTQLNNLESQLAEQDRLILLKTSSLAAAEAQAESLSADLVSTNERVRSLEEMVESAEVELQSAIRQMSDMQSMVRSTDEKLVDAQGAMVDRNNALPGLKRLLKSLSSTCGVESFLLKSWAREGATTAVQEAERLMTVVEEAMSVNEASLKNQQLRCDKCDQEVAFLKSAAAQARDDLAVQRSTVAEQQSTISEIIQERDVLISNMSQKSKEIEALGLKLQNLLEAEKRGADQLQECQEKLTGVQAELDRVTASSQHASGQLAARCEEVDSVRSQLTAADDLHLKLKSRLRESDREMAMCRARAEAAAESQAVSHEQADLARRKLQNVSERLDESETRVNSLQLALEKRNQEACSTQARCTNQHAQYECVRTRWLIQVRELNSMLKAWEAMRLSKDAQIAALMERCKRYDEDIAEKGRSNEALRRKLMHHHGAVSPHGSLKTLNDHVCSQQSTGASVAGSLSASDGGRTRHIHLHMHGAERAPGSSSGPTRPSFYHLSQNRNEFPR